MEVEELVRISRNVFRPRRQRLSGRDAILQHLAVNQTALVAPTRRLLDEAEGADATRYEANGAEWVPAPLMQVVERPPEAPAAETRARPDRAVVAELMQMRQRIETLESSLAQLLDEISRLQEVMANPVPPVHAGSPHPGPAALEGAPDEAARPASIEPELTRDDPGPAEPEPDYPPLKVPALDALLDLARGLVGESVRMSKGDPGNWVMEDSSELYMAALKGDSGTAIGALVMDLQATIRLAGGMLMEAEEDLAAQIEEKIPSDDILDAAGEVLNTLTSAINKTSGNAHVRAGALQILSVDEYPWIVRPRRREDFTFSIGGRLAVIAR